MLLPVYKTKLDTSSVPWNLIHNDLDSISEIWKDSVNSRSTLSLEGSRHDMEDWAKDFRSTVTSIVHKFMPYALNLNYDQLIVKSWFNRIYPSGCATKHNHGDSDLAIVWYIDKPDNSGNIIIEVNGQDQEINVDTGDLIAFPGGLNHYTKENISSLCRYVLVVDIKVNVNGPQDLAKKVQQRRQEKLFDDLSTWYDKNIKGI